MNILEVADAWDMLPWEVARAAIDQRAVWYWRQLAWEKAKTKRANIEAKRAQSKHG